MYSMYTSHCYVMKCDVSVYSFTCIVLRCAFSLCSYNGNETVSTLRFGMRAKSIENKVQVNQTRSIEELGTVDYQLL